MEWRELHVLANLEKAALVLALPGLGQPALAQDAIPPKIYSTMPGGINVSDGSFVYSMTDPRLKRRT